MNVARPFTRLCGFLFFALLLGTADSGNARSISEDALKQIRFDQKLGAQVSPDLQFHDEDGKLVRLGDYLGKKPVILVLGYYQCPMLCSFVLNGMIGSLQDIKWDMGNQFDVINVSIDPAETPALAAAKKASYVKRYGRWGAAHGWHFLTGDEPAIRQLAGQVGFGYAYDPEIKQYAHPSGLIILTPDGTVSQYLSGVIYSREELSNALVAASSHKVGSPIKQLFLLCFHYSPITGKYGPMAMVLLRVCGALTFFGLVGFIIAAGRQAPRKETADAAKTG